MPRLITIYNPMKYLIYSLFLVFFLTLTKLNVAQCPQPAGLIYNSSFQQIKFGGSGVTVSNKVGNGKSVNDIVVYENVLTIVYNVSKK